LDQIKIRIDEIRTLMTEELGPQLLGVHLEGPFLNPDFRGQYKRENLALPGHGTIRELIQACKGVVRLVTLAPELDGTIELIKALTEEGIVTALGHSEADRDHVAKAIDAGLSHVTHIFNAMAERSYLETGRVKPGLSDIATIEDRLTASVVADGFHVSDVLLKLLVKAKGVDEIVLISDSVMATTTPGARFVLPDGREAYVDGNITRRVDDGVIAGPILTLNEAVRNMIELSGVPQNQAVQMASYNAAKLIGMAEKKGSIAPGSDADLVIVDDELNPIQTLVRGKVVYSKPALFPNPPWK
jgi:N-acetylglucosamine-6-phosphate deacetylase